MLRARVLLSCIAYSYMIVQSTNQFFLRRRIKLNVYPLYFLFVTLNLYSTRYDSTCLPTIQSVCVTTTIQRTLYPGSSRSRSPYDTTDEIALKQNHTTQLTNKLAGSLTHRMSEKEE